MSHVDKQFQEYQLDFDAKIRFDAQSKIPEYEKSVVEY